MDLIINTLKNAFLLDSLTIESVELVNNKITIIFKDEDEERWKYKVALRIEPRVHDLKVKSEIIYSDIDLLINPYDFVQSLTLYTAKGMIKTRTTLDTLLEGVIFNNEELEDIL